MNPICADESCVFIHYKPTGICLILHLTTLCSPQLGLISFVLRTNVVSFFFHVTIWLLIKQPRCWDGGFGGNVLFNFPFFPLRYIKGPGTTLNLFQRLYFLAWGSCLWDCLDCRNSQANWKMVQLLLKYVSCHLIPLYATGSVSLLPLSCTPALLGMRLVCTARPHAEALCLPCEFEAT